MKLSPQIWFVFWISVIGLGHFQCRDQQVQKDKAPPHPKTKAEQRVVVSKVETGPATSTQAPNACTLGIDTQKYKSIAEVSNDMITKAMIPSFDSQTRRAGVRFASWPMIMNCREQGVPDGRYDEYGALTEQEKQKVDMSRFGRLRQVKRQDLPDGRQAVWIVTYFEEGVAPAGIEHGFIGIVRLERDRIQVEAIALWENGEDAEKRFTEQTLDNRKIWFEPTGHTGTGGGSDGTGERVWMIQGPRLVVVGEYELQGNRQLNGDVFLSHEPQAVVFEDKRFLVYDKTTWDCVEGNEKTQKVTRNIERRFAIVGDRLVEEERRITKTPYCENGNLLWKDSQKTGYEYD